MSSNSNPNNNPNNQPTSNTNRQSQPPKPTQQTTPTPAKQPAKQPAQQQPKPTTQQTSTPATPKQQPAKQPAQQAKPTTTTTTTTTTTQPRPLQHSSVTINATPHNKHNHHDDDEIILPPEPAKSSVIKSLLVIPPHDFLRVLWRKFEIKKSRYCWLFWVIIFLPFFFAGSGVALALGVLIPFGLIFGLIEHHLPPLWGILVLAIQVGGALDVTTDVLLLGKLFLYVFEYNATGHVQTEWDELQGRALAFFEYRLLFTMIAFVPGMFVIYFLMFSETIVRGSTAAAVKASQKSSDDKSSSRTTNAGGMVLALILFAIIWKLCMVALRLYSLFFVVVSLIKHKKLQEKLKTTVQWVEVVLFCDLIWSGLPLGIITFMELYVYQKEGSGEGGEGGEGNGDSGQEAQEKTIETLKLGALAVDLFAMSYLFWFVLVGLFKKWLHGDHKHHDKHSHADEHAPLIA